MLLFIAAAAVLPAAADKASDAAADLQKAQAALRDYRFDEAQRHLAAYRQAMKRARFAADPEADDLEANVAVAKRLLGHVEDVVVIDSVSVPLDEFWRSIRIPASAGRILSPDHIPFPESRDLASMAYSNEAGDYILWSQPDSVGTLRLMESTMLTDGSWTPPHQLPDVLNGGGDADYPFLSADGTMLYFSADGDGSMGGYDIFVTARDPQSGEYLEPSNIGMPYNSPDDDFLLAADEQNGVGWWATMRNEPAAADGEEEERVTLYVYLLSDDRPAIPEDADAAARARIADYRSTWPEEEDYADLLATVRAIDPTRTETRDFSLPMPGRKIYTRYADFQSKEAAARMQEYMNEKVEYDADCAELRRMRRDYAANPSRSLRQDIPELEHDLEQRTETLRKMLSDVYRLELR